MVLLGDVVHVESRLVCLEMVLVLEQRLRQPYHRLRYRLGRTWVMWNLVRSVWRWCYC